MQLSSRQATCSTCSRPQRLQLRIVANASNNGYVPPSPSSLDRPSGGGSRSFDLPRSSDITYSNWGPSSDILRPSGGASRFVVFSTASSDRPGGRGGRSDMPAGWDAPTPQDPASARPGGRGGRDLGLEGGNQGVNTPQDPALARPGGRGGRDIDLFTGPSGPAAPISLDRPGGRGGRESVGGGDGGDGNSGGSGGDGNSGGSGGSSGDDSGFSLGQGLGAVVLYAGVIAAAWAGNQAFFAKPAPAAEVPKPCCAGKGKKK